MMTQTKATKLEQIDLGPLSLKLKAVSIGQGRCTVGLVLGVHGVETTGLFVLEGLYRRQGELKNVLRVIPSANPSGLLMSSRFGELDIPAYRKDPNRVFPGDTEGSVQERVNAVVLELINNCDFVIDVHNYSNVGTTYPIVSFEGIPQTTAGGKLKQTIVEFTKSLRFKWAYFVDEDEARVRSFSGTLTEALHRQGIPSLSLELPPIEFVSREELDTVVSKIIQAVNLFGQKKLGGSPLPRLLKTQITKSSRAGVFLPEFRPPQEVSQGEMVGRIFDPFAFEYEPITAPQDGLVIISKRRDFVRVGDFLFEIGWEVKADLG